MSIKGLEIEGATKASGKKHAAVAVTLKNEDGKPFKIGGTALTMHLRPQVGLEWEEEVQAWSAKWGQSAQFRDNPDLSEKQAKELGANRGKALLELRARSIARWNIGDVEATLENRAEVLKHFPEVGTAVDREVQRITEEITAAQGN